MGGFARGKQPARATKPGVVKEGQGKTPAGKGVKRKEGGRSLKKGSKAGGRSLRKGTSPEDAGDEENAPNRCVKGTCVLQSNT